MCPLESDAHAVQGLAYLAQGAGEGRVFEFEAFDGQIDVIGQVDVLGFGFEFKLKFDLLHQRMQVGALCFGQRRILFQLLAQGIELLLQFAGRQVSSSPR